MDLAWLRLRRFVHDKIKNDDVQRLDCLWDLLRPTFGSWILNNFQSISWLGIMGLDLVASAVSFCVWGARLLTTQPAVFNHESNIFRDHEIIQQSAQRLKKLHCTYRRVDHCSWSALCTVRVWEVLHGSSICLGPRWSRVVLSGLWPFLIQQLTSLLDLNCQRCISGVRSWDHLAFVESCGQDGSGFWFPCRPSTIVLSLHLKLWALSRCVNATSSN